ncbi:MAG: MFS transporter, partial [Patescibacteria group bacterium]
KFAADLSLSPVGLSVMLAVPVLVGSLARIPFGVLTDRFGGHRVFTAVCFLAILPVMALAFVDSYNAFLVAGAFLGIAGASFAVGVPYVNAWFPPQKRGLVLGIYSMGNAGTAVSGFLTPSLATAFDRQTAYITAAAALLLIGVAFMLWGHDSPTWKRAKGSAIARLTKAMSSHNTWDLALLYSISFGAFVAFGVYLPVLLKVSYGLSLTDAAARAAGFVLLATAARPVGGWLSDHVGGARVIRTVFAGIAVLSAFVALQPSLAPATTVAYLSLAFVLGCGNGAIIALVSKLSKPDSIGSVTGIVGACGGLGGFLPPLILGVTYQRTRSYSLALLGLSLAAALVFVYISRRFKRIKLA